MTKIMTTIVVFDLLKKGETSLDEKITISEKAWRMSQSGYSSMFIMLGDQVSVEDLLKGIIIVSGNDACVALAEGLSGTEEDFVILMNEKAEEIGMENTNFNNSSGINDADNYSTVRDILKMSRYLIEIILNITHTLKILHLLGIELVEIQLLKETEIHFCIKILVLMELKLVFLL